MKVDTQTGIVGLLIAQGLKKVYHVRSTSLNLPPVTIDHENGWGLPLLKHCFTEERYSQIHTAAVDPYYEPEDPGRMPTYNGATGELIKDIPLLRMYRVSRRRFRTFCAEGIDVQYGKSLNNISYSNDGKMVKANFEDNTSATGSLLVGADGTHSPTRHQIFINDKEKATAKLVPYNAINLHVCYGDVAKAQHVRQGHPIMYHGIHPKGYWQFIAIQDVPDPDKPETWVFQLQTTWKKTTEPDLADEDVASLEKHWKRAEGMGEPFKSANLWIPEGTKVSVNKMAYWVPEKWDTRGGRVILAGDAGHPMTFQRGQGLNHGIADAAYLIQLLKSVKEGNKAQDVAIEEYMNELVERAGEEVRTSIVNTDMLHDWGRFTNSPIFTAGGHASQTNKIALEAQRHKEELLKAEEESKS
ncbi:hypothetical protein PMZ80_004341 [Knufia obscura]|uniref:FAD-binding domain-containing protein n=1 Tax=Knufia obscura TaxID=1635080 RepID=A0ABR0RRU7_9EURO|nr:hypothetical protein PMZ80_004341 [Knufia obscura]